MTDFDKPLSDDETRDLHAKALAGHLISVGEEMFGDLRVASQSATYDALRRTFPTLEIHISDEDGHEGSPYVQVDHPSGPSARNYGGGTLNIFAADGTEVDVVTRSRPDDAIPWTADDIADTLDSWVEDHV